MKWLIGVLGVLAALAGFVWYAALDGAAPARADREFDLAAYRALVANDAPGTLPTEVRVEFVGVSQAPSFTVEAGALGGDVTIAYTAFQLVTPHGAVVIDGALDRESIQEMSDGEGRFDEAAYRRLIDATAQATDVLITHEHVDHVMAIVRHPEPEAIAPRLRLTRAQLQSLPQHARGGALAPAIANAPPLDLRTPQRIAPGVVAAAAPGHTPGSIVIFVRTPAREYLVVGDIAWAMSNIENLRGRPRFIGWLIPEVDPDRSAVLRQIRALHDIAAAEPALVILPAHDNAYLRQRIAEGALIAGFAEGTPL